MLLLTEIDSIYFLAKHLFKKKCRFSKRYLVLLEKYFVIKPYPSAVAYSVIYCYHLGGGGGGGD